MFLKNVHCNGHGGGCLPGLSKKGAPGVEEGAARRQFWGLRPLQRPSQQHTAAQVSHRSIIRCIYFTEQSAKLICCQKTGLLRGRGQ